MNENIKLADLGAPLFSSRSSELFGYGEDKLLKLFFADANKEFVDNEEINLKETFEKGISEVELFDRVKIDDRDGLIIKKLPGKTLLAVLNENPSFLEQIPSIMTRLQLKAHSNKTNVIRPYKEIIQSSLAADSLSFLNSEERSKVNQYVNQLPEGDSVLHLDYHPDNIMSDKTNSFVIDWATAARGVPSADVATSVYLISNGEVPPGTPPEEAAVIEQIRVIILEKYLENYRAECPVSDEELELWKLAVLIVRLGIWNVESEAEMLRGRIREEISCLN